MTSTLLSSGIIGAITMCHNGSLGMKLAHLLFLCVFFLWFLVFSLKFMNMQIRSFALFIIQYQVYVSALERDQNSWSKIRNI